MFDLVVGHCWEIRGWVTRRGTHVGPHLVPVVHKLLCAALHDGSGVQRRRFVCQVRTIVCARLHAGPMPISCDNHRHWHMQSVSFTLCSMIVRLMLEASGVNQLRKLTRWSLTSSRVSHWQRLL